MKTWIESHQTVALTLLNALLSIVLVIAVVATFRNTSSSGIRAKDSWLILPLLLCALGPPLCFGLLGHPRHLPWLIRVISGVAFYTGSAWIVYAVALIVYFSKRRGSQLARGLAITAVVVTAIPIVLGTLLLVGLMMHGFPIQT